MPEVTEEVFALFFQSRLKDRPLENVINVFRYYAGVGHSTNVADVLAEAFLRSEQSGDNRLFTAVMENLINHIRNFILRSDQEPSFTEEELTISSDVTTILFYRIRRYMFRMNPVDARNKSLAA